LEKRNYKIYNYNYPNKAQQKKKKPYESQYWLAAPHQFSNGGKV